MKRFLFLILLAIGGCALFKSVARGVNDAASILCEDAASVKAEAQRQGVSVEELCAIHDVLSPFIDEATKAQRAAVARAGFKSPTAK